MDEIRAAIDRHHIDRHSFVLAIGGGALLDSAGYAAATAHRGVRLVRVPTTVLAQNDSALGVKNGINAFGKKNFVGTFAPPFAVVCDYELLLTLSDRDWRAGISEAVKVALLKDPAFFAWIEDNAQALAERSLEAMAWLIHRCAELHLEHIAHGGDPFELGSSRPLDFGHWAAHKLEQLSGYRLRHGEAVAIGIALDSAYSRLAGHLPLGDWRRIVRLFDAVGLPTWAPELEVEDDRGRPAVLAGLDEFREHLGGRLTVMLLAGIGSPFDVHTLDEAVVLAASRPAAPPRSGTRRARGMSAHNGTSPLTQRALIDEYFMEHRVQVLELAAFLDRLERARDLDAADDFRLRSVREALGALADGAGNRVQRVQMIFSDPRSELLEELDQKSAKGAYDPEA